MKIFAIDKEPCESCENLKEQLNIANHEKRQLLETIIDFTKPKIVEAPDTERVVNPIQPKAVLWRTRQAMLEQNDRETARIQKEREKEIKDLEIKVGLEDAEPVSKSS